MLDWSREGLAWVAGIIEGEGCFSVRPRKAFPNQTILSLEVKMTDGDIIHRLKEVTGLGTAYGPYTRPGHRKPIYRWKVSSAADIYALAVAIYPWMGTRRSGKIREVIEAFTNKMPKSGHSGNRLRGSALQHQEVF